MCTSHFIKFDEAIIFHPNNMSPWTEQAHLLHILDNLRSYSIVSVHVSPRSVDTDWKLHIFRNDFIHLGKTFRTSWERQVLLDKNSSFSGEENAHIESFNLNTST